MSRPRPTTRTPASMGRADDTPYERTHSPGLFDHLQQFINVTLETAYGAAVHMGMLGQGVLDVYLPANTGSPISAHFHAFAATRPKLAIFIAMNLLMSGIPLGIFILFAITTFVSSAIVAFLVGLISSILFTLIMVAIAFSVALPIIITTTSIACSLFIWGLAVYYIKQWATSDEEPGYASNGSIITDAFDHSIVSGSSEGIKGGRAQNAEAAGVAGSTRCTTRAKGCESNTDDQQNYKDKEVMLKVVLENSGQAQSACMHHARIANAPLRATQQALDSVVLV